MENFKAYAQSLNANEQVLSWIRQNLANYLKTNTGNQDEIENIIDYLVSPDAPQKNLIAMSYPDAHKNAEKWMKKQIKKGEHIKEATSDIEVVLDFKDGFKIVKLVGKNAYEREGYLMRHCVASYYGSSKEIYSLRDGDNSPHATLEKDQQIKGKGNGNIHPKYVGYVVKFLEYIGMTVGDNEMKHLGYLNMEKFKKDLSKDTKYFNGVYLPEDEKLIGTDGEEFASLDLLDIKPLVKESTDGELQIGFDLEHFLKLSFNFLVKFKKTKAIGIDIAKGKESKAASSGDYSKAASSGDYSKAASSGYSSTAASSGYSSTAASSGYSSTAASSGDYSKAASSGDYSKAASSGDYSKAASSGDSSKAASLGNRSSVQAEGNQSIAAALGYESKAKGKIGTWLVLSEYAQDYKTIFAIESIKIDGEKIKEDTWYVLKGGKFVEKK